MAIRMQHQAIAKVEEYAGKADRAINREDARNYALLAQAFAEVAKALAP